MEDDDVWIVQAEMFDGEILVFGPFANDMEAVTFAHTYLNDTVTETDSYIAATALVGIDAPVSDAIFVRKYLITTCFTDAQSAREYLYARATPE